ncbi:hypothetical protein [Streptomyces sp. NPDC059788]|uniref:glycosyl hydrolase family 95 catalytic domain-containing protein n=1 Tax=Streptomyces sp. NPDC059788 TaxID=3346948 RepID=UPI003652EC5A
MNAGFGRRSFLRTSAGVAVASSSTLAARPPGEPDAVVPAAAADPYENAVRDAQMEWTTTPELPRAAPFLGNGRLAVSVHSADGGRALRFTLSGQGASRTRQTAHLDLIPDGQLTGLRCTLDLWNAELTGTLTTTRGSIAFTALVAADKGPLYIRTSAQGGERGPEFSADSSNSTPESLSWDRRRSAGRSTTAALSLGEASAAGDTTVRRALASGPDEVVTAHRRWWHAFYRRSFVSLPDRTLQRFHWIQMYSAASLTDPAVRGLTHAPALLHPAHHLGLGPAFEPPPADGASPAQDHLVTALPGVGSKAGRAPHPVLAAGAPLLWDVHRHTGDLRILRDLLHPALRRAVDFCAGFLVEGADGRLHLPLTHSPGQADVVDCTYDLALLRWAAKTLVRTTRELGADDERLGRWREIAARLAPYHRDAHGVMLGQGRALTRSDPEAAHLLWLWPLGEMSWSRPADREVMRRSFDHWAGMREAWHAGSYALAAALASALHDPRRAVAHLRHLTGGGPQDDTAAQGAALLPNTLYAHAASLREAAPFAAGRTLVDLLVREDAGVVEVFPAASALGPDACVAGLRVSGAFAVDAARRDGRTRWARVHSTSDRLLRLRHGITGDVDVLIGAPGEERRTARARTPEPGLLSLRLSAGESVTVLPRGTDPACEVGEVPPIGNGRVWGGGS